MKLRPKFVTFTLIEESTMYSKILVAIDLSKDTDKVFKAALRMAIAKPADLIWFTL